MKDIAYYNGEIGRIDEIKAPITDRGFYFGDGVYDAACVRNKKPFALDDHLDRFYNSLCLLRIESPMPRAELDALLRDLCTRLDTDGDYICYWQATRGAAHRKHSFPQDTAPRLMAFIEPTTVDNVKQHMKLITVEDTRFFHCNIKTLNLIPNILATQAAREAGCDEVVFHRGDNVTECAHSNIAMFKDGVFCTPPQNQLILPGITRKHCLALCASLGIPTNEDPISLEQLFAADEVLVLSSGCLGAPVSHIDDKPVGGKEPVLMQALQNAYQQKFDAETAR